MTAHPRERATRNLRESSSVLMREATSIQEGVKVIAAAGCLDSREPRP